MVGMGGQSVFCKITWVGQPGKRKTHGFLLPEGSVLLSVSGMKFPFL
jgi:hypothetical protein